jgi:hypothetical protein
MPKLEHELIVRGEISHSGNNSFSWLIICVFSIFTILFTFVGPSKVLNYIFPISASFVAIFLYSKSPILYNGFSWWMWFLAPLVRRLVDLRSGFTDPSPMLLAPYLVSLVSIMAILQSINRNITKDDFPFVLSFLGVTYGAVVGIINKPYTTVFIGTLNWIAPICFGFHVYKNWRLYPEYKENTQKVFMLGILMMSVYGIFQYFRLSDWDLLWLKETGLESGTGGVDESTGGGTRIWSTMQSPEPFAAIMAGGLLLLTSRDGPLSISSSVVGYIALLLTLVRSAWLGWLGGLLSIILTLNPRQQGRLISLLLCLSVLVIPISLTSDFSEKITTRVSTLADVQSDGSAQIRQQAFNKNIDIALSNPVGDGIENGSMDSSLLSTLFYLGWVGTIPYVLGLLLACFRLFNASEKKNDPFISICQGIVVSILLRLPANGSNVGASGVLLWTFLGMAMAADRYGRQNSKLC